MHKKQTKLQRLSIATDTPNRPHHHQKPRPCKLGNLLMPRLSMRLHLIPPRKRCVALAPRNGAPELRRLESVELIVMPLEVNHSRERDAITPWHVASEGSSIAIVWICVADRSGDDLDGRACCRHLLTWRCLEVGLGRLRVC